MYHRMNTHSHIHHIYIGNIISSYGPHTHTLYTRLHTHKACITPMNNHTHIHHICIGDINNRELWPTHAPTHPHTQMSIYTDNNFELWATCTQTCNLCVYRCCILTYMCLRGAQTHTCIYIYRHQNFEV
jgi:hypothetical protein